MIKVRDLSVDSLDAVVALDARCHLFPWTRQMFSDSWEQGHWFLGIFLNEILVGYAIVGPILMEHHLLSMTVDINHQRQGFGRKLLQETIQHSLRMGGESMLLEVRAKNIGAQRLYEQFGFVPIGIRKGYYPAVFGVSEDAIVMRAFL